MRKKLHLRFITLTVMAATLALAGFKQQMPAGGNSAAPVAGEEMPNHMPVVIRCVLWNGDDLQTVAYATGCHPKTNVRCIQGDCPFREGSGGGAVWYHNRPVISDCIVYDGYQWRTVAYATTCMREEGALCIATKCP